MVESLYTVPTVFLDTDNDPNKAQQWCVKLGMLAWLSGSLNSLLSQIYSICFPIWINLRLVLELRNASLISQKMSQSGNRKLSNPYRGI